MSTLCFLCNQKASTENRIALHRFPLKDPNRCKEWKNVCGLSDTDDISRTVLCSLHFETCYKGSGFFGKPPNKMSLIRTAIPTINVPFPDSRILSEKTAMTSNMELDDNGNKGADEMDVDSENNEFKIRKSFEPRYVSEILPTDFDTPKRKKRTMAMILKWDKAQKLKIKRLNNLNFKYIKKIRTLTDLVKELKKGHGLSRESGDSLLVNITSGT